MIGGMEISDMSHFNQLLLETKFVHHFSLGTIRRRGLSLCPLDSRAKLYLRILRSIGAVHRRRLRWSLGFFLGSLSGKNRPMRETGTGFGTKREREREKERASDVERVEKVNAKDEGVTYPASGGNGGSSGCTTCARGRGGIGGAAQDGR